ncbi:MAG TPA: isochorismatase, partial [Pseudonocardia sp.]|nr:isochorismatase [Pseudonocardia sp.]
MSGPHGTAFSGRVGWGARPAVLVVDLVRGYTAAGGPFLLPDPQPAVAATAELVDAARAAGHPVVWTVVRYTRGMADGG